MSQSIDELYEEWESDRDGSLLDDPDIREFVTWLYEERDLVFDEDTIDQIIDAFPIDQESAESLLAWARGEGYLDPDDESIGLGDASDGEDEGEPAVGDSDEAEGA